MQIGWSRLASGLVLALAATGVMAADRTLGLKEGMAGDRRIALVIGNGAYRESPLANPVNDARLIAGTLKALGFQVSRKENQSQGEMIEAIRQFGDALRQGGVGLFYYAGHGMQVRGRNFLIPVNARIEREDEVAYLAVDANLVLEKMDSAGNRLNLVILDACRNNPFARSFRSGGAGLAQMDAPVGTLIAFATAPGTVASDGPGKNGLYTEHLIRALNEPGLKVEEVFKRVRAGVRQASDGRQIPWESTSLEGDFFFRPGAGFEAQGGVAGGADLAVEMAFWDSIKDSDSAADYRAYLDKYPNGQFVALARNRLEQRQRAPVTESQAVLQPPLALARPAGQAMERVALPRVGDTWTYQYTNGLMPQQTGSITFRLESLDRPPNQEATEAVQVAGLPPPAFPWYSANIRPAVWVREQSFPRFDFSPYLLSDRVPEKGYRWEYPKPLDQWQEITDEASKVNWRFHGEVLGREMVLTPAGHWDAVKVEVVGSRDPAPLKAHHATVLKLQLWYAPQAKRWVKSLAQVTRKDGAPYALDVFELASLKLQKD